MHGYEYEHDVHKRCVRADTDNNGVVEWADFQLLLDKSSSAPGSTLEARCRAAWDAVRDACDLQHNGRVSLHNWLAFWGAAAEFIQVCVHFLSAVVCV